MDWQLNLLTGSILFSYVAGLWALKTHYKAKYERQMEDNEVISKADSI